MDKLRVKSGMIYPSSLCHEYTGPDSIDSWLSDVRHRGGHISTFEYLNVHGVKDSRVGPWRKYPLSSVITPLLERRRSLKAEMKQHPPDSDHRNRLNATQKSLKKVLVRNSSERGLRGLLASEMQVASAISSPLTTSLTALAQPAGSCPSQAPA